MVIGGWLRLKIVRLVIIGIFILSGLINKLMIDI